MSEGHFNLAQNDHRDIMQNLSFIFQEECRMKIEHVFKITVPCVGRSYSMCSHDPIFGTNKNRILKNGSCERALKRLNLANPNLVTFSSYLSDTFWHNFKKINSPRGVAAVVFLNETSRKIEHIFLFCLKTKEMHMGV